MQQAVWDIEPEPTRRLVVMRHARAEAFAESDLLRELTPSGVADAHAMGAWLLTVGVRPDRALVSPAVRTRQTWDALMDVTGWGVAPEFDEGVYAGVTDTLLDEIRNTDPDAKTMMLLGHNPAMASLAQILPDGEGDLGIELAMAAGFPTCSAAVFGISGEWSDLEPGAARLLEFHIGRTQSG